MIDLQKVIRTQLIAIHPRVYFQSAPRNSYPYLVFNFSNIFDDGENFHLINLEVDGWDDEEDETGLDALMKNVNCALNKKVIAHDNFIVMFYLESKLPLIDVDPHIHRRKYTYQGRLFERS